MNSSNRNKILLILLTILIILATYYITSNLNKPTFKLEKIKIKKANSKITLIIKGYNNSRLNEIPVKILLPNNTLQQANAKAYNQNTWITEIHLSQEGTYEFQVINPYTKETIRGEKFEYYDKPEIEKVNLRLNGNLLVVNVTARDLTGIEKVLFEAFGKNFTLKPVAVNNRGNGLYSTTIKLNSTSDFDYRVFAIDKTDREMASTYSSKFNLTGYQKFIVHCLNNGLSLETAKILWNYNLIRELFELNKGKLDKLLGYVKKHGNTSLTILNEVLRDDRVSDKNLVFKVYELLDELNLSGLSLQQIWLINNATYYGYYSLEGLEKAVKFIARNNLNWNFSKPIRFSALADTCHFIPEITEYPQETYYFTLQVGDTFYYYKIIEINGTKYAWNKAILPYAKWRYGKLIKGEFVPIGVRLVNGDLAKLAKWADKKVVEAATEEAYSACLSKLGTKVYSINIDPFNSKTVYAVAVIDKRGKILKTEDGGESWKDVYTEPASGTSVLSLALDPVDSKKVYAGTSDGQIIFSENGGDSWKSLYWANNGVYKIAVSKFNPQVVLFAVFQGSILRTNDGGRSFEDLGKREIEASEGERYRNSEFLRNPTAITFDPYRTDWVYVGSSAGLVRSKNAGDSWELVQILNKPQEQAIRGVKINPQNSDEIIYGASQTFYKSIDGGTNWKTIQFNTNRTLETVVYDPKNPSVIYVGMNKR